MSQRHDLKQNKTIIEGAQFCQCFVLSVRERERERERFTNYAHTDRQTGNDQRERERERERDRIVSNRFSSNSETVTGCQSVTEA